MDFAAPVLGGGVLAGFNEELVFRGYLRHRIAAAFGRTTGSRATGVVASALCGLLHVTEGLGGVVVITSHGCLSLLAVCWRRCHLRHAAVAHATANTVAFLAMGMGWG